MPWKINVTNLDSKQNTILYFKGTVILLYLQIFIQSYLK